MSDVDIVTTLCGQECTSYLLEGEHACRRCAEIEFESEMSAEAEFFRDDWEGVQ